MLVVINQSTNSKIGFGFHVTNKCVRLWASISILAAVRNESVAKVTHRTAWHEMFRFKVNQIRNWNMFEKFNFYF